MKVWKRSKFKNCAQIASWYFTNMFHDGS